jgi:hypothetical protein
MSRAESAAREHGAMPQALRDWATKGAGGAEIGWGAPGDYDRCLLVMGRHVDPKMLHGLCGNLHEIATGMSTAEHAKLLGGHDKHTTSGEKHASKIPKKGS